ncbi:MAG: beta-lactamase family protein [Phaeodactylibacter sp.]|nr:beta-lactamase family protein [Phaeodactylibacter sp.]
MLTQTFHLFGFLLISYCTMASDPPAAENAFESDFGQFIQTTMEAIPTIPGISVAVVKDGQPIYTKGFGYADKENGVKATEQTSFYIASSTKSFTGLMAALLDQKGLIQLDEAITTYLPAELFPDAVNARQIKVRDLLTHTMGMENGPVTMRLAFTGDHSHEKLKQLLQYCEPTEKGYGHYQYSNFGYNLYGIMLEEKTGKPWQQWMEELLFEPLGMSRTTAYMSKAEKNGWPVAAPYSGIPGNIERIYLEKKDNTMQSAGGLITTAEDMGRWLAVNLQKGKLDGKQIFPAALFEATHGRLAETGGEFPPFTREHYGLGWHIGKYDKFAQLHHFGGFAGFSTHVSFLPQEGLGVAVMVNDAVAGTRVMNLLAAYAYDWWLQREKAEKNGQKGLDEITKRMEKVGEMVAKGRAKRAERTWQLALPFEAYAGVYYNDSLGTLKVANADNALEVSIGNLHCTATPYTDENSIRIELVPGSGEVILFDVKDDKVASFRYDNTVFEKVQ